MVKLNIRTASSLISHSGRFKRIVNDLRSKAGDNLSPAQEIKLIILSVLLYLKAHAPKSETEYVNKLDYLINNFNNITEIQRIATNPDMFGGNMFDTISKPRSFHNNALSDFFRGMSGMPPEIMQFIVMATVGIIGFAILQISLLV
jgi:hypothetical protein